MTLKMRVMNLSDFLDVLRMISEQVKRSADSFPFRLLRPVSTLKMYILV